MTTTHKQLTDVELAERYAKVLEEIGDAPEVSVEDVELAERYAAALHSPTRRSDEDAQDP